MLTMRGQPVSIGYPRRVRRRILVDLGQLEQQDKARVQSPLFIVLIIGALSPQELPITPQNLAATPFLKQPVLIGNHLFA